MVSVVIDGDIRIPDWIADLESFRRWCRSDEFPPTGRIDYLQGEVWVDTGGERVIRDHPARTEFTIVLGGLVKSGQLGRYYADGLRLTNPGAGLSVVPTGLFISNDSLRQGVAKIREGWQGQIKLDGTADMVLELTGDEAGRKAEKRLRASYRQVGIKEFWRVEVRGERMSFDIFRLTVKGYVATRKRGGWLKSNVFGKSFRLTRQLDRFDNPEYTLEVR